MIGRLSQAIFAHGRVLVGVVPGLMMTALHSTMLVTNRAEFVDALDSDRYRIQWITGSYILGSAWGMAMTGYLGQRTGLRNAFLLGLALFTFAGTVCVLATEVIQLAPLRLGQGFGNGLIISVGMVIIWRAFPIDKGLAMALYGMAIYLPALIGAMLGGFLATLLTWRLGFALILPLGIVASTMAYLNLSADRPKAGAHTSFDWVGLILLLSWISTMSVVLDRGQYWGWLSSPQFVPWFVGLIMSFTAFLLWGFCSPAPLINLRVLANRNFTLGLAIKILFSIDVLVLLSLLTNYMVNLRGYQWWQAGLVLTPACVTMCIGITLGSLLGKDSNRKLRLGGGLMVMSIATAAFRFVDLYTAKELVATYLGCWGIGAGVVIGPALLTAFESLSSQEILHVAGFFNIARSLPAFIVGSVLSILLTQHTDAQFDVLRQDVRFNRAIVEQTIASTNRHLVAQGSPAPTARKQAHAVVGKWVHANAHAFALQGIFASLAAIIGCGILLVSFIRLPRTRDESEDKNSGSGPWKPLQGKNQ
jgi:DHA2 family multidrug resistance protein